MSLCRDLRRLKEWCRLCLPNLQFRTLYCDFLHVWRFWANLPVPLLALLIRDGITRAVTLNEPFPATIGSLSSTEEDTVLRPLCSLLSKLVGNTMQTSAAQRDQLRHAACQGGVLEAFISFPSGATLQGEQFSLIACKCRGHLSGVEASASSMNKQVL